MSRISRDSVCWWIVLMVAGTLPFLVSLSIKYLGGYFADYMYLSAFKLLVFTSCWVGLFFSIKLLSIPQRLKALRIAGMVAITTFLSLVSCTSMISSLCQPEFIELTRLGVPTPNQVVATAQELESESCS